MRALLSTIGSRGDVQPLVALALQLRADGHEARLCVPPDFREWIESLGLPVTPIGPEVRHAAAAGAAKPTTNATPSTPSAPPSPPAPPSPERRRQLAEATIATQFETIAAAARGCDVIVGATALQLAARSVAEQMGIRYVFVAYCPAVLPSPHHAPPPLPLPGQIPAPSAADNRELWARDAARFDETFGAALDAARTARGLPPVDGVRRHMFTDHPWLAADPTLAPWPDPADGAVFQTGAFIQLDERPLPPELEAFLASASASGEPPVYFGFGSTRAPQDLARAMVDSARALGRRAIVSRGWADLSIADEGADCLTIGEVNVQALFRRVAAVVHHGGAGTTTLAALAGAPQVVVPQIYDQHYWARRVDDLGIGAAHAAGAPTADSLATALDRALRPDVAARARAMSTAVRRDGTRIAAGRLISPGA
jgi:vancomycin aglycone glucosyltransferase